MQEGELVIEEMSQDRRNLGWRVEEGSWEGAELDPRRGPARELNPAGSEAQADDVRVQAA